MIEQSNGQYKNLHQNLIKKCKEQDQSAQFDIYLLYYRSMYNTSLRIINDPVEAEDIMQESFLSAFTKIESYKGDVSFGAWLKKIVINKSIDALRKRKIIFEELNSSIENLREEEQAEDQHELEKQVNRIKETLKSLPDGCRIVLSLYLIEGYDHEEIGQILNITESSSRSQLTRAKKKLLEFLSGGKKP